MRITHSMTCIFHISYFILKIKNDEAIDPQVCGDSSDNSDEFCNHKKIQFFFAAMYEVCSRNVIAVCSLFCYVASGAEPYPDITMTITMQRRPHFYIYNHLMPCGVATLFAFLGFYAPGESGEKITLGITTLLSLTLFMLMVGWSDAADGNHPARD